MTNHTTAPLSPSLPASHLWTATFPPVDGDAATYTSLHRTRAGAVAAVLESIPDYTDERPSGDNQYHYQPVGMPAAWYSSWTLDSGYLVWTVQTREICD